MLLDLNFPKKIAVWFYENNLPLKELTADEKELSSNLSRFASNRFKHSRSYLRYSLSNLFNIDPLKLPIIAKPNEAPILKNDLGFISISHCNKATVIAWAPFPIGIDIEEKERKFPAYKLYKRYFQENEKLILSQITHERLKKEVLKYWIIKESAFKWQKDNEFNDLFNWEWIKEKDIALNKKKGLQVNTYMNSFKNFFIGLSYNGF